MGIKVIKKVAAPVAEQPAPVQKITKTVGEAPAKAKNVPPVQDATDDVTYAAEAVGVTTKEYKDGSITEEVEQLGSVKSSAPMASVHISMGVTRNLGNYESVKVSVGVTLPCLPTAEDIDETYTQGKGWVDDRINAINEEVSAQIG